MPTALRTDEAFFALKARDSQSQEPLSQRADCPVILVLAGRLLAEAPTATEVVRPVKTMVVSAGAESNVRTFPGRVEASNKVELAFQVSGLLVSLPVREGQKVAKNEVIAQLQTG